MKNIKAINANELKQREAAKRAKSNYYYKKKSKVVTPDKIIVRKLRRAKRKQYNKLNPKIRHYSLYALLLENGKYYVGMTSYGDPQKRFLEHVEGGKRSALWTKLHKPIRILETRPVGFISDGACAKLENIMTIEYILKYGIDNVRGGSMCSIKTEAIMKNYNIYANVYMLTPQYKVQDVLEPKVYIPARIRQIQLEEW